MLAKNKHMETQIEELQMRSTVQEETLRVYRRLRGSLNETQEKALVEDLTATEQRLIEKYGKVPVKGNVR